MNNVELSAEQLKLLEQYNKRKEYMKEYNQRDDVKAKRKEYMKARYENQKAMLQQLKQQGII